MELLEWLRRSVDCEYISDMKYGSNNRIARLIIKKADFSKYSMDELSDAANYLYGKDVSFSSADEAKAFFENADKSFWDKLFHK